MGTVAVHVDAAHVLGVAVAADMVAAVDDQALLPGGKGLVGEHRSGETCADDQVIKSHTHLFLITYLVVS